MLQMYPEEVNNCNNFCQLEEVTVVPLISTITKALRVQLKIKHVRRLHFSLRKH